MDNKYKKLILKGGFVCGPFQKINQISDIVIIDGKITEISNLFKDDTKISNDFKIIDVKGMIVMPGLVDLHTHLRDPGYEWKEDIYSGSLAAAKGGFTTICAMPNTSPVPDSAPVVRDFFNKSKNSIIRTLPFGSITKGRLGKSLSPMYELQEAGVVGFSDDGDTLMDSNIMRQALLYSIDTGLPIINHAEDIVIKNNGVMNSGLVADRLGLKGTLPSSEYLMVKRDIDLAFETGGIIHIPHISTEQTVSYIFQAKDAGLKFSSEVTPHHLTMTEEWVYGESGIDPEFLSEKSYDTNAKVNPPLRSHNDVSALIQGINEGIIDTIATDHAPHSLSDKECSFDEAAPGINNIETAFSQLYELVKDKKISLEKLVSALSVNPSRILNKEPFGSLHLNKPAELTIFDPNTSWVVNEKNLLSKSSNTPLKGKLLNGKIVLTIFKGRIVYDEL